MCIAAPCRSGGFRIVANSRCRAFCYLRCQAETFENLHSSSVQTVVLVNSGAMATLLQQVQAAATLLAHYAGQPDFSYLPVLKKNVFNYAFLNMLKMPALCERFTNVSRTFHERS